VGRNCREEKEGIKGKEESAIDRRKIGKTSRSPDFQA
jgi:hypothetical protein